MSVPNTVYLDTSVIEAQQYNFASTALTTFVSACAGRAVTLLLPEVTEAEVFRHISERTEEAFEALQTAQRKAPFLARWPKPVSHPSRADVFRVRQAVKAEWFAFLKEFEVVRLDYKSLDITRVMGWYSRSEAPFAPGKKRKEFPDAFAVAILEAYATTHDRSIAVVSHDTDWKLACGRFTKLMFFSSLPKLTQLLLSKQDDRIDAMRSEIERDLSNLEDAVLLELYGIAYVHSDARFEIKETNFAPMSIEGLSIVALGDLECAVTFNVCVEAEHLLRWEDDTPYGSEWLERSVTEEMTIPGSAKISFDVKGTVENIAHVALEADVVTVTKTPT